ALTLARAFAAGDAVSAVVACDSQLQAPSDSLAGHGVGTLHVAEDDVFGSYAPRGAPGAIGESAGCVRAPPPRSGRAPSEAARCSGTSPHCSTCRWRRTASARSRQMTGPR